MTLGSSQNGRHDVQTSTAGAHPVPSRNMIQAQCMCLLSLIKVSVSVFSLY